MDLKPCDSDLISVVIPIRPKSQTISKTLTSLLRQDYENFEVICLLDRDNGSIRNLIESEFPNINRKLIDVNVASAGLGNVRNIGLKNSDSNFIAMLDCDDICKPNRLTRQISILKENEEVAIVTGNASVYSTDGKLLYKIVPPKNSYEIKLKLLTENCIVQSSVMLRKSDVLSIGGYTSNSHGCEDYDLWLRMISKFEFGILDFDVVDYLMNPVGVTRKQIPRESRQQLNRSRREAQKYLKIGTIKSAYQIFNWNIKQFLSKR